MTDASPKISITLQLGHVKSMANAMSEKTRRDKTRDSEAALMERYSAACIRTMSWLVQHEADIKAWLALPASDRALILARPSIAAQAVRDSEVAS